MNNTLLINNLQAGYSKKTIIKSITFTANQGEITTIIGPNGSGKSTLLNTIVGDISFTKGMIKIGEIDISKLSIHEKAKKIAIVNQYTEPLYLTIKDYVILGRTPYRNTFSLIDSDKDKAICNNNIELVGIKHLMNKKMHQTSSGERQLASIAKALTQEPQILLLDEPTSNLDIKNQHEILNVIQKITKEKQITTILVLHDINLAINYSDKIAIMNNGEITHQGIPDEIITKNTLETTYNTPIKIIIDKETEQKAITFDK